MISSNVILSSGDSNSMLERMLKINVIKMMVCCFVMCVNSMLYAEVTHKSKPYYGVMMTYMIGSGLMTWGAYELGSTPKAGKRNVAILWGGALVSSLGIVLYQSSLENNNKGELSNTSISVMPTQQKGVAIALQYDFL